MTLAMVLALCVSSYKYIYYMNIAVWANKTTTGGIPEVVDLSLVSAPAENRGIQMTSVVEDN